LIILRFIKSSKSATLVKYTQPIWSIKSDRVNLVALANPVHRVRYSTNWDRKGWPGSEIQIYYGCPCNCYCSWHIRLASSPPFHPLLHPVYFTFFNSSCQIDMFFCFAKSSIKNQYNEDDLLLKGIEFLPQTLIL